MATEPKSIREAVLDVLRGNRGQTFTSQELARILGRETQSVVSVCSNLRINGIIQGTSVSGWGPEGPRKYWLP